MAHGEGGAGERIVQRALGLEQREEWQRALAGLPHSFFHTWEHSYAMHLTHGQAAFLYCAEAGDVRVVCPFLERPVDGAMEIATDIATPYGFSGFTGNGVLPGLPELWREFAASRGYVSAFLNLHPLFFRAEYADAATVFEQKELYILNTAQNPEAVMEGFDRGRRNEIRSWQSRGKVYTEREHLKAFVLAHYREFFRRKGATEAYDFSLDTMQFLLEQENVLLLGAGSSVQVEAVVVVPMAGDVAEWLFHFNLAEGRGHSSGLLWETIRNLQQRGIASFNLGGGMARNDSLARFKSRFVPAPHLCSVIKQVFDAQHYAALCTAAGANAGDRSGYFPAYRKVAATVLGAGRE